METISPGVAPTGSLGKGKAIAALVFGIVGVVMGFTPYVSLPAGIIALILGIMARRGSGRRMAIAGIILGVIALILGILVIVAGVAVFKYIQNLQSVQ